MRFEKFQEACRYFEWAIEDYKFKETCRNPRNIPQGASWGKCNERYCPYYGIKILGGAMYDSKTGEKLMEFGPGSIVF